MISSDIQRGEQTYSGLMLFLFSKNIIHFKKKKTKNKINMSQEAYKFYFGNILIKIRQSQKNDDTFIFIHLTD